MSEEEIRLDQTKKVFEAIADIIVNESCTYRYLIYDMLGFKTENYIDLMSGLTITNAIVDLKDFQQENERLKEIIEETKTAVDYMIGNADISEIHGTKLKQILDKVGDK